MIKLVTPDEKQDVERGHKAWTNPCWSMPRWQVGNLPDSADDRILIYSKRDTYQNRIFAWRIPKPHRAIRMDRPLTIDEALAMVEDNWSIRTFVRQK